MNEMVWDIAKLSTAIVQHETWSAFAANEMIQSSKCGKSSGHQSQMSHGKIYIFIAFQIIRKTTENIF